MKNLSSSLPPLGIVSGLCAAVLLSTLSPLQDNPAFAHSLGEAQSTVEVDPKTGTPLRLELKACQKQQQVITCTVLVTALERRQRVWFTRARLIDFEGNEYTTKSLTFGSGRAKANTVIPGVPLKLTVKFDTVPGNLANAALFEVRSISPAFAAGFKNVSF